MTVPKQTMADHNELSITRTIAAPPAKVWDIMTNRIEEWWCPKPWRAEFDKLTGERAASPTAQCMDPVARSIRTPAWFSPGMKADDLPLPTRLSAILSPLARS